MSGEIGIVDPESTQALMVNNGNTKSPKNVNNDLKSNHQMSQDYEDLREQFDQLRRYLKALAAIVILGIVIFIVVVTVLYTRLNQDLRTHSHHVKPKVGENITKLLEKQEMCYRCSKIRLGPSVEEDNMMNAFRRRQSADGEECCVDTASQLLKSLELYVEKRFLEEVARDKIKMHPAQTGGSSGTTTAAHLMGPRERLNEGRSGRQFAMSNWTDNKGLAFRSSDIKYRYGRLVIPEDGIYYVYSQVSFLEVFDQNGGSRPSDSQSLSHYIYRYNVIYPRGGEEVLNQNSITKCWAQNKAFGEYSSFLGAVFHLRKSDEVFVKVSSLSLLATDPKLNYFGLFRV